MKCIGGYERIVYYIEIVLDVLHLIILYLIYMMYWELAVSCQGGWLSLNFALTYLFELVALVKAESRTIQILLVVV
jgi:hypothetical protein